MDIPGSRPWVLTEWHRKVFFLPMPIHPMQNVLLRGHVFLQAGIPGNDQLCEEAVTFYQSLLLGTTSDMDDIVRAITKIYENRDSLVMG